ncbi:MAG: DUF1826 domain-containing protein [Pseudomonadota bacterium]
MFHQHKRFQHRSAASELELFDDRAPALDDAPAPDNSPVRTIEDPANFDAIFDAAVDAVIWRRALPSFLPTALHQVASQGSVERRVPISLAANDDVIDALLREMGFEQGAAADWMAHDLKTLTARYGRLLSVDRATLRFEIVRDDACRKFHRDVVRARMICTYSGPGTEYGAASSGGTPESIERAPTGSPILLKGARWPKSSPRTVLHRSPPIEGTGASRFVVVIDEG